MKPLPSTTIKLLRNEEFVIFSSAENYSFSNKVKVYLITFATRCFGHQPALNAMKKNESTRLDCNNMDVVVEATGLTDPFFFSFIFEIKKRGVHLCYESTSHKSMNDF